MKNKLLLTTFLSSFFILHSALGQGALTPPGAPAPTMKTLAQIEPRTPISAAPFTISTSGSYYLTTNVTVTVSERVFAITIAADNVTLDLNGFTIASTAASAAGAAILLSGARTDVAIYNGHISSGVTNTAAGVFGGGGFGSGIYAGNAFNVRVKAVSVAGVLEHGIFLNTGNSTVVEGCTVNVAGGYGIYADSVADSTALNCGISGIVADTAQNCKGSGVGSGDGLSATTANNCSGSCSSSSSSGNGLSASTANNCSGSSSGNGTGLYATTANNCYGYSASGNGLSASTANNCYGSSYGNGYGLAAYAVATGCYGYSSGSGTGLYAFIASVCHGVSTSGTALSTSHNVNSF